MRENTEKKYTRGNTGNKRKRAHSKIRKYRSVERGKDTRGEEKEGAPFGELQPKSEKENEGERRRRKERKSRGRTM